MTLSMTGYGRSTEVINGRSITVEIKSVNSRYFEYSSRIPRAFTYVDDKIKKQVSKSISRGKIEVSLQMQNVTAQDETITANIPLAAGYLAAMRNITKELGLHDNISIDTLSRFNDIFVATSLKVDEEQVWNDIKMVLDEAIDSFITMRTVEGEKLKEDILDKLSKIEKTTLIIEKNSEERVQKYTDKLYARMKAVLEDANIDEARILTEAAIYADKTAVDEETVRLHSHIKQYRDIFESSEPVGRKLDFLTQELNREVNTIGSKCQDLEITKMVVDTKSDIEKIREQVQNIE
ncbi:MAG: YicC/YloC family endoribonuclease [Oscillospiraceae bacterium]